MEYIVWSDILLYPDFHWHNCTLRSHRVRKAWKLTLPWLSHKTLWEVKHGMMSHTNSWFHHFPIARLQMISNTCDKKKGGRTVWRNWATRSALTGMVLCPGAPRSTYVSSSTLFSLSFHAWFIWCRGLWKYCFWTAAEQRKREFWGFVCYAGVENQAALC